MLKILVVALGGAFGSIIRYGLSNAVQSRTFSAFPYGTLMVNLVGCFLIGLAVVLIQQRFQGNEVLRLLIVVGVLGGFTTFSSFSMETLQLLQSGYFSRAMLNIMGSVFGCLLLAFLGMQFGRIVSA